MKKCIIVGSKGYIGRNLEYYIKQKGIIPFCYDRISCNDSNYKQIDITNKESIQKIDLNVDYIFWTAGLTGTYAGFDEYEKYININEIGLLNLLDIIRKSKLKPKIIFPSSRLVYKGKDSPLKENDEKETKTIYAVNKLACEGLLNAYYSSYDIPYTIFRICIPYGNLLGKDYSYGTIALFLKQASNGKDITLYGDGASKRTFTSMNDLCYQIVEGSFLDASNEGVYNIGGSIFSLKEVAEIIASKYSTKVIYKKWSDKDIRIESGHTYFDDNKIQDLLGRFHYEDLKIILK